MARPPARCHAVATHLGLPAPYTASRAQGVRTPARPCPPRPRRASRLQRSSAPGPWYLAAMRVRPLAFLPEKRIGMQHCLHSDLSSLPLTGTGELSAPEIHHLTERRAVERCLPPLRLHPGRPPSRQALCRWRPLGQAQSSRRHTQPPENLPPSKRPRQCPRRAPGPWGCSSHVQPGGSAPC